MKRKISALVDNHLDEHSAHVALDALRKDTDLRHTWDAYCLIGDVLRKEKVVVKADFVSGVMHAIDEQPTLFAPAVHSLRRTEQTLWQKLLPVAASVMGFAVVGWVAGTLYAEHSDVDQIPLAMSEPVNATKGHIVPASVVTTVDPLPDVRPADHYQTYLFAHQSVTGMGGIQSMGDSPVVEVEGGQ